MLQGFTREFLNTLFHYDLNTGLVTRRIGRSNIQAGAVVGTLDGKGYLHVSIHKRFLRLHRIIWFMETGTVPPQGVDHRNNIRTDNRWLNLRAANQHNNSGNIAAPSHNTSGVKGVSRNAKSEKWHAQIKIFGKQTYLGRSSNIWVAALLYNFAAENHFGAFAKLNSIPDLGRVAIPPDSIDLYL